MRMEGVPSSFLQNFASKEWNKGSGKNKRGLGVKSGGGPNGVHSQPLAGAAGGFGQGQPGGRAASQHGENEREGYLQGGRGDQVMPFSHLLDGMDPREKELVVGGSLEAAWEELAARLKASFRAEAEAQTALRAANEEADELQEELAATQQANTRLTKERVSLEEEVHMLKRQLAYEGITPLKVGMEVDPWSRIGKQWANEARDYEQSPPSRARRTTVDAELELLLRSIESLERTIPALSSAVLYTVRTPSHNTYAHTKDSPARSARAVSPVKVGHESIEHSQVFPRHVTSHRAMLTDTFNHQDSLATPSKGLAGLSGIAAATSVLASPAFGGRNSPVRLDESRVVFSTSDMYQSTPGHHHKSHPSPAAKPSSVQNQGPALNHHDYAHSRHLDETPQVVFKQHATDSHYSPRNTPRQLSYEVKGGGGQPAGLGVLASSPRRWEAEVSPNSSPPHGSSVGSPGSHSRSRRSRPGFGLSRGQLTVVFDSHDDIFFLNFHSRLAEERRRLQFLQDQAHAPSLDPMEVKSRVTLHSPRAVDKEQPKIAEEMGDYPSYWDVPKRRPDTSATRPDTASHSRAKQSASTPMMSPRYQQSVSTPRKHAEGFAVPVGGGDAKSPPGARVVLTGADGRLHEVNLSADSVALC